MFYLYEIDTDNDEWEVAICDTLEEAKSIINYRYSWYERKAFDNEIPITNYVDRWIITDDDGEELYEENVD